MCCSEVELARKNFRCNESYSHPIHFATQNNQAETQIITLMTDILKLVDNNLWHLFYLSSDLNKAEKKHLQLLTLPARVHFTLKLHRNQPGGCHVSFSFYAFFLLVFSQVLFNAVFCILCLFHRVSLSAYFTFIYEWPASGLLNWRQTQPGKEYPGWIYVTQSPGHIKKNFTVFTLQ